MKSLNVELIQRFKAANVLFESTFRIQYCDHKRVPESFLRYLFCTFLDLRGVPIIGLLCFALKECNTPASIETLLFHNL